MTTIVFSKDRALQLDAFLRSYRDHVVPLRPLHVLRLATTARHASAYDEVFAQCPWAIPLEQGASFKMDLLNLLPRDGHVVFFVDDMVFLRRWNVLGRSGLSLRLGLNLTHNYSSGDAKQPLPDVHDEGGDLVSWFWLEGQLAWGYPLSLDGHVYKADLIRTLIGAADFHSPNTLESALQARRSFIGARGTCYRESKVVSIPWNRVQTDWENRCALPNSATSAEEMLEYWELGQRIDLTSLDGVLNESVHQEFPLVLENRT